MPSPAVDTSIREMPQVAELIGDRVTVTCRVGYQPLYRYTFPAAEWPEPNEARLAYLRALAEAVSPAFFSTYGALAERCLVAQAAAVLKLNGKEAG